MEKEKKMYLTDWEGPVIIYNTYNGETQYFDRVSQIPEDWNFGAGLEEVEVTNIVPVAYIVGSRGKPDWV